MICYSRTPALLHSPMVMNFEELQEAITAENTFPVCYVEAWASRGVCPPPLSGDPDAPTSVVFCLATAEKWDLDGAPLAVSDEAAVEVQQARCEDDVRRQLDGAVRLPGTDLLVFPYGQAAMRRLGQWPRLRSQDRGAHWAAVRPYFWVWGAAPSRESRWILDVVEAASEDWRN